MKAVVVLFDTLSRRFLSSYGNNEMQTSNFQRLQMHCTTFDNHYSGSLPCMPARREMHTGSYNFLYRSWGPLEPFDYSIYEDLSENHVYTHICTDHSHYWEDGGAGYLQRYSSWEGFRGQEGDRWKPCVDRTKIDIPELLSSSKQSESLIYNYASRQMVHEENDFSSVKTMTAGLDFLGKYHENDNWLLQIECFDPHEPFFVPDKYLKKANDIYNGLQFDWPKYGHVTESNAEREHLIKQYAALILMCDSQLGRLIDTFDQYNLWDDTALIVTTDHGFLMGEHDLWGKNFGPQYEEIAHIPLYVHIPHQSLPERTSLLTQTIDIPATLADFFNINTQSTMQGKSIIKALKKNKSFHDKCIYGVQGSYIHLVSGNYVFMCAPKTKGMVYEYTMMPTHMRGYFREDNLNKAEVCHYPGTDTKVLRIPSDIQHAMADGQLEDYLFDLSLDPQQLHNIQNADLLSKLRAELKDILLENYVDQSFLQIYGL